MWKLLIASDGSADALALIRALGSLNWAPDTRVRVLTVLDEQTRHAGEGVSEAHEKWARQVLAESSRAFGERPVQLESAIRTGHVSAETADEARDFDADLVGLGSRGLGAIARLFLGSVARNLVSHADCPVWVGRGPAVPPRRVLIATDGSDGAMHAIDFASRLPWAEGTEFAVLSVALPFVPVPDQFGMDVGVFGNSVLEVRRERKQMAERLAESGVEQLKAAGLSATAAVREGDPAHEIIEEAEAGGHDLIIAGARGVSLWERLLVGSVADRLASHAHCSLLLVR